MNKNIDVLSIGTWAIFDHIFRLSSYPNSGDTVTMDMPIESLNDFYFGDCSANIAAVAAKLGVKSALGMVVGEDFSTSGYRDHLHDLGVNLNGIHEVENAKSGHNYIYFDTNGDGFCISHQGIAADQSLWQIPEQQIREANYVVISEKFSEYTLKSAKYAKQCGSAVVINGMVATAGNLVLEFIQNADYLFIAESEMQNLLRSLGITKPSGLIQENLKIIFVTKGKKGCTIYTQEGEEMVPSILIKDVLDTTGAGDAFTAGTLTALIKGKTPFLAAQIGATVSSFIIQAWGCQTNLPTWEETNKRLNLYNKEENL